MTSHRVIEHLRRAAILNDEVVAGDADLLARYVAGRSEAAFEALLLRHSTMVLGVCRRVLRNEADAQDAFQATFLVFVRKAATIRVGATVANWLYGVAYNTARKARAMRLVRAAREREAARREAVEEAWGQVRALVDGELNRLPAAYRSAIVLCDLEGRTLREAAHQLGWPQGTVATRLTRGRALLARRLAAKGLPLAVPGIVLSEATATAVVPPILLGNTIRSANSIAAGPAEMAGTVSARVSTLTEGVIRAMSLSHRKIAAVTLAAVAVLATSWGLLSQAAPAKQRFPEPRGAAPANAPRADDAAHRAIVRQLEAMPWYLIHITAEWGFLRVSDRPSPSMSGGLSKDSDDILIVMGGGLLNLEELPIADGVRVTIDGKPAKARDLRGGMLVKLKFAEDKLVIAAIDAVQRREGHVLHCVDAEKRTITVTVGSDHTLKELPVAKDVYIYLYNKGNTGKLSDLEAGMRVSLGMKVEGNRFTVHDIRARKF